MISLSSIQKDSISATQDSSKGYILACKVNNQMHNFCSKMAVLYKICSLQYLCLYLWQKFLKNMFEVVHT